MLESNIGAEMCKWKNVDVNYLRIRWRFSASLDLKFNFTVEWNGNWKDFSGAFPAVFDLHMMSDRQKKKVWHQKQFQSNSVEWLIETAN